MILALKAVNNKWSMAANIRDYEDFVAEDFQWLCWRVEIIYRQASVVFSPMRPYSRNFGQVKSYANFTRRRESLSRTAPIAHYAK